MLHLKTTGVLRASALPGRGFQCRPRRGKAGVVRQSWRLRTSVDFDAVPNDGSLQSDQQSVLSNEYPENPMTWDAVANLQTEEWNAYKQIARIHNFVPSCLLVFVGAWVASARTFTWITSYPVWLMALVSGGVSLASVIVNDYFDFLSGIDKINSPDKPLPSGVIRPDIALLLTLVLYVMVLVAGCVLEPPPLRWIIAMSAASTLVYTPVLKSMTGIKNFVVASVVAASPAAGALATGMGMKGFQTVLPMCAFLFCTIMAREILMDINDTEGDKNAGVWTLPIMLGKSTAAAVSTTFITIALGIGITKLWTGTGVEYAAGLLGFRVSQVLVASCLGVSMVPMFASIWNAFKSKFDPDAILTAINRALQTAGVGLLVLAILG